MANKPFRVIADRPELVAALAGKLGNTALVGATRIIVSATAPVSPQNGDLWIQPGAAAPADTTAPNAVTGFTATAGNTQNVLAWTNPVATDFAGVKVLRKAGGYPTTVTDGTVVYTGVGTDYTDTARTNGVADFYAVYAHDAALNYSTAAQATATPAGVGLSRSVSGALFADDFSSGNLGINFQTVPFYAHATALAQTPTATLASAKLRLDPNKGTIHSDCGAGLSSKTNVADCIVEALATMVNTTDNDQVNIILRGASMTNNQANWGTSYWARMVDAGAGVRWLDTQYYNGTTWTPIGSQFVFTPTRGQAYRLKSRAVGSSLALALDGTCRCAGTNSSKLTAGYPALLGGMHHDVSTGGISAIVDMDEVVVMSSETVTVTGVPAGGSVKITGGSGGYTKVVNESAGVATLACAVVTEGEPSIIWTFAGARIDVYSGVNGTGDVVVTKTSGVYGGDTWTVA